MRKPITIRLPRRTGEGARWPSTKFGRLFMSAPKVIDGKLAAGKQVLVNRYLTEGEAAGTKYVKRVDNVDGPILEVSYGEEWAKYKLVADRVVWNDGPPHPEHLQIALRDACSEGVINPAT